MWSCAARAVCVTLVELKLDVASLQHGFYRDLSQRDSTQLLRRSRTARAAVLEQLFTCVCSSRHQCAAAHLQGTLCALRGGAAMDSRGGVVAPYPPQLTLDRRPIIDGCATVAHAPRVGRRAPDGRHGLLRRQDERRRAHLGRNDGVSTAEGARHSPRNRFARRRPLRARCVVTPTVPVSTTTWTRFLVADDIRTSIFLATKVSGGGKLRAAPMRRSAPGAPSWRVEVRRSRRG